MANTTGNQNLFCRLDFFLCKSSESGEGRSSRCGHVGQRGQGHEIASVLQDGVDRRLLGRSAAEVVELRGELGSAAQCWPEILILRFPSPEQSSSHRAP